MCASALGIVKHVSLFDTPLTEMAYVNVIDMWLRYDRRRGGICDRADSRVLAARRYTSRVHVS